jgi:hypothetical protein
MINRVLYYSEWANLQASEFAAVDSAFEALLLSMQSSTPVCAEFLCVSLTRASRKPCAVDIDSKINK